MGLLERVSTLVRANLNDLIDRAENPSKMIKQVILDMENQLLQVKTQVAISIADQHMLEKKTQEAADRAAAVTDAVRIPDPNEGFAAVGDGLGARRTFGEIVGTVTPTSVEGESAGAG